VGIKKLDDMISPSFARHLDTVGVIQIVPDVEGMFVSGNCDRHVQTWIDALSLQSALHIEDLSIGEWGAWVGRIWAS
jgi:hypothetical protein